MSQPESLFEHNRRQRAGVDAPLADRMRPASFETFVGQEHVTGPDRVLPRALGPDRPHSFHLWGPPGRGQPGLAATW